MFQLDDPKVERFLYAWFSGMGFQWGQYRHYHDLYELEEYKKYIKNCYLAGKPAFHSVSPNQKIHRIFWEFDIKKEQLEEMGLDIKTVKLTYDSPHLDFLWEQALKLAMNIAEHGGKPLLMYSGNKGFHCWVYSRTRPFTFDPNTIENASILYKMILHGVMGDEKDYPNWDKTPTSFNSMARIPFSFHQKSGNQVIPLTFSREPYIPQVDNFLLNPIDEDILYEIFDASEDVLETRRSQQELRDSPEAATKYRNFGVRRCIGLAMITNPDHPTRLAYLLDAIYANMTDEQIHKRFRELDDYDYNKTQYQIEHSREAKEGGVKPFSRATLIRLGIMKEIYPEGWGK